MSRTKFESFRANYKKIPVYRKFSAEGIWAEAAFLRLKNISEKCFILESAGDTGNSRYSFIGFSPSGILSSDNTKNPIEAIREFMRENKSPKIAGLPPFTGGLAGYFSYDFIKYTEPTLRFENKNSETFKDFDLMIFDKIAAFDKHNNEIIIIVNSGDYDAAMSEADRIFSLIKTGEKYSPPPLSLKTDFAPMHSKSDFCEIIEKTKNYIKEGDIFQAVLSNKLEAQARGSLFEVFRKLKAINPSPYMLYFSSDELEIAGSAPETLISVNDGIAATFPLAGTRPRGNCEEADKALERELLSDEKELAEHNMLVDLGRNDLGKICEIGTVEVSRYKDILRFSHVMHIGSEVRGKLRDDLSAIDAIAAALPAGTLSGAPKIRACEIIEELEQCGRGIYGGAAGYLSYTGDADVCIAIRLAFLKNGKLSIRSGAGIVADSNALNEYAECENKLAAVKNAILEGGEAPAGNVGAAKINRIRPQKYNNNAIQNSKTLIIDNYDSFTYNLYQLLGEFCEEIEIVRNDKITLDEIEKMNPKNIIISPGPGKPSDAGICEAVIKRFFERIPILGICLGHQAICEVFGNEITYADKLMHGKQSDIIIKKDPIFRDLPDKFKAARYHSLAAKNIKPPLEIIGETASGEIMAVRHETAPLYGLQFHPESILTPLGKIILKNFCEIGEFELNVH